MKKIISLILLIFIIFSCTDKTIEKSKSEKPTEDKININPVLLNELEYFLEQIKSDTSYKVINVHFTNWENNCELIIYPCEFYYKEYLIGYYLVDDFLIAFNSSNNECISELIEISKLELGTPEDFINFEEVIDEFDGYDPSGKVFRIHSKDSLELIHKGGL